MLCTAQVSTLVWLLFCMGVRGYQFAMVTHYGNIMSKFFIFVPFCGLHVLQVLLKWRVGDASLYQMSLFLSMLGLFTTLTLWPILLLLHLLDVEVLEDIPWGYICASSVLGLVFNFSINFGIAYTFPLFISLGTILGIPLNAIVDVIVRHIDFLNWKFLATDLIVGGFLLMLVPPSDSVFIHKTALGMATCKCCRGHQTQSLT